MEDMQQKLEQYRLRKRRKEKFDEIKEKFKNFLMLGTGSGGSQEGVKEHTTINITQNGKSPTEESCATASSGEDEDVLLSTDEEDAQSIEQSEQGGLSPELRHDNKVFKYTVRVVYFLFWVTLYIIAIELKFGIVFLMFSALLSIYFNTRTGPKRRNEISAYSVFNKNCESIDGTLKAEQFEREMRYGAASVK